jgi:hypothetical protein
MLTIHLRITDAATKKPLPVRLRITDAAGNYYAPLGRLAVFACGTGEDVGGNLRLGKDNFAYIDGSCEIVLPAGVPLRIQAFHGFERIPLDETVTLGPGQMALRFEMPVWRGSMHDGMAHPWTRIDTRCHFLDPHAALLEAAAEDVDVVNVLAHVHYFLARDGNTYPAVPNITAFSGQTPALAAHERQVFVSTFNTHPMLGKLGLLNCHRVVYPLAFGGAEGSDDWSLCDWADQCHRKGGMVVWCDAFRDGLLGGEALVALILGKVDAIEFDADPKRRPFLPWVYHLWNAGFRVPLVGASGKDSNRVPVGAVRTYSPPPGARGARFLTNGPLIEFIAELGSYKLDVKSVVPFHKTEVIANGEVISNNESTQLQGTYCASHWDQQCPVTSGWFAARVVGGPSVLYSEMPVFAHTSPVFVGEPVPQPAALAALRQCVEQTREWFVTQGKFTNEKRKAQHLERCDAALARLAEGHA